MAGQKFWAHGTTVTIDGVDIGGLSSIGVPEETRGDVETTDNKSGGDREFLPGLRDGGTVTFEGRKIPGDLGQDRCRTNYQADAEVVEVIITLPAAATNDSTTATITFDVYVNGFGGDLPQDADEPGQWSVTMKITSKVTEAVA